ncbi:cysteine hydrolase family protein [Pararhizobium sp. A13]|uniref:cysteine hydrolase family protein n=1 Tax=Pararhizobium sp. A13 TaxID=3133975 RepID=UPI0032553885
MKLSDKTALIPVDMQQAFDRALWPARWNDKVDANGLALLSAWRATGRPIIHVRHDSIQEGSSLWPESPGNAFRPGFEPQFGEPLVTKSVNAAFIGTDLDLRLRRVGIDTIVVFGISTDMCVSTTVRVGSNMGYKVILVEDSCDCFDLADSRGARIAAADIHQAHVATLRAEFATVVTTAEILGGLESVA